jgi:hypothetical protein
MKHTITFAIKTLGIFNSYAGLTWEIVDPSVWNGTTLPDGSDYATYGQASDDWWRFGAGETELWSGSTIINDGDSSWFEFFSGFSTKMFRQYHFYIARATYIFDLVVPQQFLGSAYNSRSSAKIFSLALTAYADAVIYDDSDAHDSIIYNEMGATITVWKITGEM